MDLKNIKNGWVEQPHSKAVTALMTEAYGADYARMPDMPNQVPVQFYFGHDHFETSHYPFSFHQTFEEFLGSLTTAAAMPDEDFSRFVVATAILLLDRIQDGGGTDDLYWNFEAFREHFGHALRCPVGYPHKPLDSLQHLTLYWIF